MWPFGKKTDSDNPCRRGHNFKSVEHTDENGIVWSGVQCSRCGKWSYPKSGRKTIIKEYPIYMCTAPFGVLFSKTSGTLDGSMSGMLTFNSGHISGSINTELEEKYIVKYMDRKQLKTKTFDAEKAVVMIGEKDALVLTVDLVEAYDKDGELRTTYSPSDRDWKIHIPSLPEVEELTSTFPKVATKEVNQDE